MTTATLKEQHRPATKNDPCPICGRDHYCLVATDGSHVICTKVESVRPWGEAGWFHPFNGPQRPAPIIQTGQKPALSLAEIQLLAKQYEANLTDGRRQRAAEMLNVSENSLKRMRCGWDGKAHTFPMSDAEGNVIGIRRRFLDGKKICVKGSKTGLFIPDGLTGKGTLLIVEGNSDCAAGLTLGFETIGRPSCTGGTDLIKQFVRLHNYEKIVIMPDFDVKEARREG